MNSLNISLKYINSIIPATRAVAYNLEDYDSIVYSVCDYFSNHSSLEFIVEGFDDVPWPVDVATDLAAIALQIPSLKNHIDAENFNFSLDFYEQGIERILEFNMEEEQVKVTCRSMSDWEPSYSEITLERSYVKNMFSLFTDDFIRSVNRYNENIPIRSLLLEYGKAR